LRRPLARLREALVLLRQFRLALAALAGAVLGGGSLYFWLARAADEPHPASLPEAWFLALSMILFQANTDFPAAWYLDVFFFVMPVIGLAILSQGVADFGVLLFNRRARGEAWQLALADTYSNHIVIVGLGHLGFRVARALHQMGESFVAIELDPEAELVSAVMNWDVPIIKGDANKYDVLRRARVDRAHTVVIVTSDDTLNLQIAIHARAVNPQVRTIVRLFDDDFAREVRLAFGITAAYSASALAAPAFAAAAANAAPVDSVTVAGRVLNMGHFTLGPNSSLAGQPVGQVEQAHDLSVVLLRRDGRAELHPSDDLPLAAGDEITVFAESTTLHRLKRQAS
jgi:Trk K+ transport system NAD-binding subunit